MITLTSSFIRTEIEQQTYELSIHADNERIADELTIAQLEVVLTNCEIIENYPDDLRGESCLILGFTPERDPVHIVCGRNKSGHLILITVYIPSLPKWKDPYTRSEKI